MGLNSPNLFGKIYSWALSYLPFVKFVLIYTDFEEYLRKCQIYTLLVARYNRSLLFTSRCPITLNVEYELFMTTCQQAQHSRTLGARCGGCETTVQRARGLMTALLIFAPIADFMWTSTISPHCRRRVRSMSLTVTYKLPLQFQVFPAHSCKKPAPMNPKPRRDSIASGDFDPISG